MMARTVADQFAEILAAAGLKRVCGLVGDRLNGMTGALRHQDRIEDLSAASRKQLPVHTLDPLGRCQRHLAQNITTF
jgi:hypothetical protein